MIAESPALSVIIASYHSGRTLPACLRSLAGQITHTPFEVLLVESSGDDTAERVRQEFPSVRVLAFAERKYCGEARNAAIAEARANLLAFLDADCTVASTWVDDVLAAHRTGRIVVSGSVCNGDPKNLLSWVYALAEFSAWLPYRHRRVALVGCCMSMRREAFAQFGPFLEGTYGSDTAFQWKMERAGEFVHFEPALSVAHHYVGNRLSAFLAHEVAHGRNFAQVRVRETRPQGWKLGAWVLGAPFLPSLLYARIVSRVARCPPTWLPFALCWPLVYVAVTAWAVGETLGYCEPLSIQKSES